MSLGFGFVEFESSRDAEDALHQFNGKSFMGAKYAAVLGHPLGHSLIVSPALSSNSPRKLAPAATLTTASVPLVPGVRLAFVWSSLVYPVTLAGRCVLFLLPLTFYSPGLPSLRLLWWLLRLALLDQFPNGHLAIRI